MHDKVEGKIVGDVLYVVPIECPVCGTTGSSGATCPGCGNGKTPYVANTLITKLIRMVNT